MGKRRQDKASERATEEQRAAAEDQIRELQTEVDFDVREYPVEVIVKKYSEGLDKDCNELFVPDYQREFAWEPVRQSRFIESVLIGLPVPYLFVADVADVDEARSGRLEIVDGSQRIRTLAAFVKNKLPLQSLDKLTKLEGFIFDDLPVSRQRRFLRRTLRMIELTEKADEAVRRDIFERINTGSVELQEMEKRRGIRQGPMLKLVEECAKNEDFKKLAPLSDVQVNRREPEEFVLRFFAYRDRYKEFGPANRNRVRVFLDTYLDEMNRLPQEEIQAKRVEFEAMLSFVERHFPNGFRKGPQHNSTPRIRFEAIAVGVALALAENPSLEPEQPVDDWLDSSRFRELTTSDSSNSRPKITGRIDYVRDKLLGRTNDEP